jgi:flavin reductase (DIM6/NTAB) family NADH-FMN oxidoreductase RutF
MMAVQGALTMSSARSPVWGQTEFESKALRQALGRYPTGVAIVTTRCPDGRAIGLTINSFASLSLSPALVLWSLVDRSPNLAAFQQASHFAISVLGQDQQALASRFANPAVVDKFDQVAVREAPEGMPVIEGAVATLVCSTVKHHSEGDHELFIGRVVRLDTLEGAPLVFHHGRFESLVHAS